MIPAGSSPFRARDPERHASELARIHPEEVHEFYGPFAFIPDLAELVRVISPGYGEMDFVVRLAPRPVNVYTNSEIGDRFLRERFPKVRRYRVDERELHLEEFDRGRGLVADLRASRGPFRELALVVRARPDGAHETERYEAESVWGSNFTCHGIDMRVAATARGMIRRQNGPREALEREATLFRGSYGKLAPAEHPTH